jgi:osmotically-inducible protein OsmY
MSTATDLEWETELAHSGAANRPRVREAAQERLRSSPYYAVRTICCEFQDGVLVLRGRLKTYFHKQIAQESVSRLDGVLEVANFIDVVRPGLHSTR